MTATKPTVSERLIAGTLELIGTDGPSNLSVRRLADASGRSTMCVYTHFGGRDNLIDAAHGDAAQRLLERVSGVSVEAREAELIAWCNDDPVLATWALTIADPASLKDARTRLIADLAGLLGGADANAKLARIVGFLVLDGAVPATVVAH